MKFEIKSRWDGSVKFSGEFGSFRLCVEAAINQSANLRSADLSGADLRSADLSGAGLGGADLSGADLRSADLSGAGLGGADLSGANLRSADLRSADLSGAGLGGADLSGANLRSADLSGADLSGADLTPIRDDFWAVLSSAPTEVPALIQALKDGKVDGSTYEGDCACLVGTLANAKKCYYTEIAGLTPNSSRPAESFFMAIREGDTPKTNEASKIALEWATEWYDRMVSAFTPVKAQAK